MEKDKIYLGHILDAINAIESFVDGKDFAGFSGSKLLQDAIIRELEIIGEAAKNLSEDLRNANKDIPWRLIMSTRDRLIHEYFGVDIEAVWQTVERDLPDLKSKLKKNIKN